MSYTKYHIHPTTGQPNKCRAEKQCPFGGPESHFSTFEEAQKEAQIILERKYKVLPLTNVEDAQEQDIYKSIDKYNHLLELDERARIREVVNSEDEELIRSVINRTTKISDNILIVAAAVMNRSLPKDIRNSMVEKPNDYTEYVQSLLVNPKGPLTIEEVITLGAKSNSDEVKRKAFQHPNIQASHLLTLFNHDDRIGNLAEPPYDIVLEHPNCPQVLKDRTKEWIETYGEPGD